MLEYREFLDLTDAEIEFILNEIFHPVKVENIQRDKEWNAFTAEITTDGWNDGEDEDFEVTDEITLKLPTSYNCGLEVNFFLTEEDGLKWKQFLLAKGCDYRLKDNPYIKNMVQDGNGKRG